MPGAKRAFNSQRRVRSEASLAEPRLGHAPLRLTLACLAALALPAGAGCGPRWDYEYGFGRQRAQQELKPLLLYFTDLMSNEHYNIQRQVFNQSDVQQELLTTVNVALSYQWGPAPRQYRVMWPHVCVACDAEGAELGRLDMTPIPAPQQFLDWLRPLKARAAGAAASAASGPAP
jgi:hypothetical protein